MTCDFITIVHGDTLKCDDQNFRLMGDGAPFESGFDAPETYRPECQQELELGRAATARLEELLTDAVGIEDSGERDRYDRVLGRLILRDGRAAGRVLIEDGFAVAWYPGYSADWCAGS